MFLAAPSVSRPGWQRSQQEEKSWKLALEESGEWTSWARPMNVGIVGVSFSSYYFSQHAGSYPMPLTT